MSKFDTPPIIDITAKFFDPNSEDIDIARVQIEADLAKKKLADKDLIILIKNFGILASAGGDIGPLAERIDPKTKMRMRKILKRWKFEDPEWPDNAIKKLEAFATFSTALADAKDSEIIKRELRLIFDYRSEIQDTIMGARAILGEDFFLPATVMESIKKFDKFAQKIMPRLGTFQHEIKEDLENIDPAYRNKESWWKNKRGRTPN